MTSRCRDCNAVDANGRQDHEAACPAWLAAVAASADDRAWFDAHPDMATVGRHRAITEGERWLFEDEPHGADVTHMWVSLLSSKALPVRFEPCWSCALSGETP